LYILLSKSFIRCNGLFAAQVVDDAEAEYLTFFASKTVAMIRAPDTYVYPAPFNLVEIVFIAPLESVPSLFSYYAKLTKLDADPF